jgi:hypothetical protein
VAEVPRPGLSITYERHPQAGDAVVARAPTPR